MFYVVKIICLIGMVCIFFILEDICSLFYGIEILRVLDIECIYFGGVLLVRLCGDVIGEEFFFCIMLVNGIGMIEIWNVIGYVLLDLRDWEYFEWNFVVGVVMEGVGGDKNIVELVIKWLGGEEGRF